MLDKKFTKQDIETLIGAMDDWEMVGNQEYHVLHMIKNAPMPPEEHEAFDAFSKIKNYFRNREKDILASRSVRQEKAIFLKAKLLMIRQDVDDGMFVDMAINSDPTPHVQKNLPSTDTSLGDATQEENRAVQHEGYENPLTNITQVLIKLKQAEFFIKDLGVWEHFQKFLSEKNTC